MQHSCKILFDVHKMTVMHDWNIYDLEVTFGASELQGHVNIL